MMSPKALLTPLLLITSMTWAAEPVKCNDRAECWPEDSAMHTLLTQAENQSATEKAMAKQHRALLQIVTATLPDNYPEKHRLTEALKNQQKSWLQYRSDECELVGTLTGAFGSWQTTHASRCEASHTERRLKRIKAATQCIQRQPGLGPAQQPDASAVMNCLQQLAPLTNKL